MAVVLLVGYVIFWALLAYPVWMVLYTSAVHSPFTQALWQGVLAFLGVIATLHVCTVLVRLVTLKIAADERV
jgi:hypothetical protein